MSSLLRSYLHVVHFMSLAMELNCTKIFSCQMWQTVLITPLLPIHPFYLTKTTLTWSSRDFGVVVLGLMLCPSSGVRCDTILTSLV